MNNWYNNVDKQVTFDGTAKLSPKQINGQWYWVVDEFVETNSGPPVAYYNGDQMDLNATSSKCEGLMNDTCWECDSTAPVDEGLLINFGEKFYCGNCVGHTYLECDDCLRRDRASEIMANGGQCTDIGCQSKCFDTVYPSVERILFDGAE